MKTFLKKLEDGMAAVAFAEAGEFETAREMIGKQRELEKSLENEGSTTIDDLISIAITFAEEGEHEKARELLREAENRFGKVKEKISHGGFVSAKSTN